MKNEPLSIQGSQPKLTAYKKLKFTVGNLENNLSFELLSVSTNLFALSSEGGFSNSNSVQKASANERSHSIVQHIFHLSSLGGGETTNCVQLWFADERSSTSNTISSPVVLGNQLALAAFKRQITRRFEPLALAFP
jgi:hypothetical protein